VNAKKKKGMCGNSEFQINEDPNVVSSS